MRMMRVSPPLLARECPGPYASTSATCFPRFARCHAVQAPNTPAPITATSYVLCPLIAAASYRNLFIDENLFHPSNLSVSIFRSRSNSGGECDSLSPCPHPHGGDFLLSLLGCSRRQRPASRSQNLRRHGVAPNRPLPRRPRVGCDRRAEPAEHLLLRRNRRRCLEDH